MCCAHGAARTDRPPVSTDRARTAKSPIFSISFSNPSKSQSRLLVACGGMRRLLEWSLGAASDDHAALDGGLSARIGKRTAENSCFSGLSSDPVVVICLLYHTPSMEHVARTDTLVVILSLENGLRDSWIAKFSRCARLRIWGSAPGSGDPFSNAHPRHSGGASPPRAPLLMM